MRTNGLLYIKQAPAPAGSGNGLDADGNPIKGVPDCSDPIPCHVKTVTDNRRGVYEDGKFRQASFDVLLEQPAEPFTAKVVRLIRYGEELGEFTVQCVEPVTMLGRIRVTV